MARYRPPTNLPTDPVQLAAVLLEHLRKISEDLSTIPTDDVNTVIVQERVDVPAGSTRRISPPTTGGVAILEPPGPANAGKKSTIILENPAGTLKVVASPHRAADGKVTASTINDAAQATYTLPGVVTFTSNGVDSWKTQVEAPAETAPSTTTTALFDALEATFHVQTADTNLPNARVATSSATIEVDHTTGGQAKWNVLPPEFIEVNPKAGGTENAYVIPATVLHGYILHWAISGAVTLNGIDATGVPDGFEFTLSQSNGGFPDGNQVTIVDESGSATAGNRFGTPDNVSMVMGTGGALRIRRLGDATTGRWIAVERGFPRASTTIAYGGASGREVQRAALTGFAAASANSNATTSAEPIVTYSSSANMSAERVTTASTSITINTSTASQIAFERAALTGDVTASANSNATTIANDAVTTVKVLDGNITLAKIETLAARTLISNNTLATATATEVPHTDLIIRPDLIDCFVGGVASTTLPNSALGWNYIDITGTGACVRNGSSGFEGIYRITTGANANDACSLTLGDAATTQVLTPTQFKYTEFKIDLSFTTSTRLQVGFMQNSSAATTAGTACCMFMFDTSVSANWITTTRAASTSTQKTSATAVTTIITTLGIATDFSGPTVRFYVNNTLIATHTALENIPTTDMNVGWRIETLTASTRSVEISRFTAIRRLDGRSIPEV